MCSAPIHDGLAVLVRLPGTCWLLEVRATGPRTADGLSRLNVKMYIGRREAWHGWHSFKVFNWVLVESCRAVLSSWGSRRPIAGSVLFAVSFRNTETVDPMLLTPSQETARQSAELQR